MRNIHQFYHDLEDGKYADITDQDFWDETERLMANTRIEYYEKPSKRPGVEPPIVDGKVVPMFGSHPKQLEFRDKFMSRVGNEHSSPVVYSGYGANRSGKTVTVWGMCFCRYIRDHAKNGAVFWCIAPTLEKAKQGPHKWLWDYLPHDMFPKERQYNEQRGFGDNHILELKLPNDRGVCTIVFHTEDQDISLYESDKLTGIVWTEATREALMRPCIMRTSDLGGFILIDYLPTKAWHKQRLQLNPSYYSMHFCMQDNAHNLSPGAIAKASEGLSKEEYELSVLGLNRAGFGAVYNQFIAAREPEGQLVKPFPVPDYWPIYLSGDWGYRNPHAILFSTMSPTEKLFVFDEQYDTKMTVAQVSKRITEKLWSHRPCGWAKPPTEVHERRAFFRKACNMDMIMDPAAFQRMQDGSPSIGDQFNALGIPCAKGPYASQLGEAAMVDTVRRWFTAGKLWFFENVEWTISDHGSWRYKENRDMEPDPKDKFEDKNNHACDALKYLVCLDPTFNKRKAVINSYEKGIQ